MNFTLSPEQQAIRASVAKLCERFPDPYWLEMDAGDDYPLDFHKAFAEAGWLGIAMPERYGGSGLGLTEASLLVQTITECSPGGIGASAIHLNIFGLNPVLVFGNEEQRQRMIPPMIAGRERACFAVTEPNTGLNTLKLKTRAVRKGDRYMVHGEKVWISSAQVADKMLLIARTQDASEVKHPTHGLSLFYTNLDRKRVTLRRIPKLGRKPIDANQVFIDGLEIPVEDRIGEEGRGFEYILHGMNPERILVAAESVGLGRNALQRASRYAKERIVFDRPIGMNQGVQHPLAECWMHLEAANLMTLKAATLYDQQQPCGTEANAAKFLAAEAGYKAAETAMLTLGGFGYAKEFHIERLLREVMLFRIAPVSGQLVKCFISEKVLGLPKSY
ncbi:MAG: acyl-CoA/acyl-ACP dehydrogenase [Burkholderiaceae bacterium]|nr:acyl-CoA/acyl-ACP dehydrogenase [Burkholderiaceae bacterium]